MSDEEDNELLDTMIEQFEAVKAKRIREVKIQAKPNMRRFLQGLPKFAKAERIVWLDRDQCYSVDLCVRIEGAEHHVTVGITGAKVVFIGSDQFGRRTRFVMPEYHIEGKANQTLAILNVCMNDAHDQPVTSKDILDL